MGLYPSDMDELRRSIGEAALLMASAMVYAHTPRMEQDIKTSVDEAVCLLSAIRDIDRSAL